MENIQLQVAETVWQRLARNARTVASMSYYLAILPMIRIPSLLPFVFATPFTILFILYVAGSASSFYFGLSGALTMTIAQQGLILGADLTSLKVEHKFQAIAVASPVSSLTYFISVALAELTFAAPALIILLAIANDRSSGLGIYGLVQIVAVIFLTWISTCSIGFFLSTYVLNTRTAFLTVTFISILLSVLPPVFYPISILPSYLRPFAELAPTTHASVLIQSALGLSGGAVFPGQVEISWIALPSFAAIFIATALLKARWREK